MSMRKKAYLYAISTLKEISSNKIKPSDFALANSNCHHNSVAAVRAGRADRVYLAVAGCKDNCVIHFINRKGDYYFDETWEFQPYTRYWIVRELKPHEFEMASEVLYAMKNLMVLQMGSIIDKIKSRFRNFDF